jgi:hypothetical protein
MPPQFIRDLLLTLLLCAAPATARRNVLFLLEDDGGFAVGAYGDKAINTPNVGLRVGGCGWDVAGCGGCVGVVDALFYSIFCVVGPHPCEGGDLSWIYLFLACIGWRAGCARCCVTVGACV